VSRPYVVYTPAGTSKTARPLVVFLHGGIGASGVKKDPAGPGHPLWGLHRRGSHYP